jgi:hypothetical protein
MKKVFVAAVMALAAIGVVPAHAADPVCTVAAGSEDAAHLQDATGDWDGTATGNGQGLPWGDVYQAASDITNSWLAPGGPKGVQAHIQVANLAGTETNLVLSFNWNLPDANGNPVTYYVTAEPNGTGGASYDTGYLVTNATGGHDLTSTGGTTGTMTTGANGGFTINVPKLLFQNQKPGSGLLLETPLVEARFLLGARGTGLLELVDDTQNADVSCVDGITL